MDRPRTKLSTFENLEYLRLQGIIRRVRWRWRLKMLLRGLGLAALAALLTLLVASWGLDAFRYRPVATVLISLLTYGALGYAAWRFLVRPLARPVSDADVALFIEERAPGLRAALLSAVQFGSPEERGRLRDVSPRLVEKVVEQALAHGESIGYGAAVDREGLRRVFGLAGAAAAAILLTVLVDPAFLRQGMPRILRPWGAAEAATPYSIAVTPGNAEVARGGDQLITATLGGFDAERVEISVRIGEGEWERYPMVTDAESARREFMLLRLADTAEYVVEAEGVRSALHRLEIVDVPYVDRIDVDLDYPDYSGLPGETIEDGGDIAALAGTVATLRITPTVEVPGGRIVLTPAADGAEPRVLELRVGAEGLEGRVEVTEPATYRIEFERYDGTLAEASPRYVVDVLADQPPVISLDEPGRDSSATPVEEVYIEASAADDYGLAAFELVWSLNGGDESVIVLGGGGRTETTGSTTFYLEEQDLRPGDFIAYYARARDSAGQGGQETATDIYFVNIRAFGRDLRQAPSGGGAAGGGGGQQDNGALARRQREIIAATFKLSRDGDRIGAEQLAEDLALLAGLQGELAEQTRQAAGQIGMNMQEGSAEALQMMQTAAAEMDDATAELAAERPGAAMGPEQRALQQLQRVEALVRELTLQMQQGGGGGEGGGMSDDLLSMLDLEASELQNQYESVQRQRRQEGDNEIDAALQRLNELARRQQQELERQQAQAGQPGGGRGDSQRQTAEQAEELARQLERLARRNSDPELQQAANRLREAADAMREAAAAGGGERSMADAARALAEMQDARRLLDRQRDGRLERDFADVEDRVEELQREQESIREQVGEMAGQGTTREQLEEVLDRKDRLAEEIRDLEMQLDDMARGSREDQLEASRGLQEAAEFIRDAKLADKVRYSKGVVQERLGRFADSFEEGIAEDLGRLAEMVGEASGSRTRQPGERLADAAEEARDLVRRLESLEDRARDAGEQQGDRPGPQADGETGEAGEPAEGDSRQPADRIGGAASGPPGARQLAREMEQRLADAEELREALREEGVQTTDLDGVITAMRDFDEEFLGTTRGLDELRSQVIDELKLFEFWLRRTTDAAEGQRPLLGRPESVPESYRALVEEYFRALSQGGSEGGR